MRKTLASAGVPLKEAAWPSDAYGLKIAGISSVKLPDAPEGSIKNNYLYNDKELFDDGGLNWYDYGFRSYDPQIGRFMQLDPLTWDYSELTNYQYASDEPIANVDMDGLEAEYKLLEPIVMKVALKAAPKVAVAGALDAMKIGINATKISLNVADHTRNLRVSQRIKMEYGVDIPVWGWTTGRGSIQDDGTVNTENDAGTNNNYSDRSRTQADHIDWGAGWGIFCLWKPEPEASELLAPLTNQTVQNIVNSADNVTKAVEAGSAGKEIFEQKKFENKKSNQSELRNRQVKINSHSDSYIPQKLVSIKYDSTDPSGQKRQGYRFEYEPIKK